MPTLLVVHHTPSPATQAMLEQVLDGARADGIEGVEVAAVPALRAGSVDLLGADGVVLATPANIGYMSGALKHFFDLVYYPCLDATRRYPWGLVVHGNNDTVGAVRSVASIAKALQWQQVVAPVEVVGEPTRADLDACWNLGAVVATATATAG